MITYKALICLLLLLNALVKSKPARSNFEDTNHTRDFTSRDNGQQWDIRNNIPGEPDIDYPIYNAAPRTSFSCDNRHEGYYADVETRCQVFRICANTDLTGDGFAFLCPNGTLFSQKNFVCDWYRNVDCNESENFYFMNEKLGKIIKNTEEMMKEVKEMVAYPIRKVNTPFTEFSQSTPSISSTLGSLSTRKQTTSSVSRPSVTTPKSTSEKFTGFSRTSSTTPNRRNEFSSRSTFTTTRPTSQFTRDEINRNKISTRKQNENFSKTTNGFRSTTLSSLSTNNQFVPLNKVYVSNLGELSTDPNSTFDPKTSVIIGSNSRQSNSLLRKTNDKKSLDQYFGNYQSASQAEENLQKNSDIIRQSLPGSINAHFKSSNNPPQNEPDYYSPTGGSVHGSLTFAEKINAGLNGFPVTSSGEDSGAPNREKILSKTVYSGSYSNQYPGNTQNKLQPNGRFFNLAENINSAFETSREDNSNERTKSIQPNRNGFNSRDSSRELFDNPNKYYSQNNNHRNVNNYNSNNNNPNSNVQKLPRVTNDFRTGRQFEFQGSGFTRGDLTTSPSLKLRQPTNINKGNSFSNNRTEYLPPSPFQALATRNDNNQFSQRFQAKFKPYDYDIPVETTTIQTEYDNDSGTVPNLLIDYKDQNAVEDVNQISFNEQDIHVKKRAENLLLQGFHLTLYEHNNRNFDSDNFIHNLKSTTLRNNDLTSVRNDPSIFETTTPSPLTTTEEFIYGQTEANQYTLTDSITETQVISTTPTIIGFKDKELNSNYDEYENQSERPIPITTRRHTVKQINYSKKPFTARNYPKTSSAKPIKFRRRRPTGRYSVRATTKILNDFDDESIDLVPLENSYGLRSNINRFRNETNKYIELRRPKQKPNTTNYEDNNTATTTSNPPLFNRTATTFSNLHNTFTTQIPLNINEKIPIQNDTNLQTSLNQANSSNTFSRRGPTSEETQSNQEFRSSFSTQAHYVSNSQVPGGNTPYTNLPGTKVTIAKSQEQGHYTISNDPLYNRANLQNAQTTQSLQHSTPYPSVQQQNPFVPLPQFLANNFNRQIPEHSTNFFLPFPTISPARKNPSQSSNQFSSAPSGNYYLNSGGNGIHTIPLGNNQPVAQRRLDTVDDEEESSLFKGPSSYNVPLSSVGRLSGDIQGNKR